MAERVKKVIVRRKAIKKRDKVELTPTELAEIKRWILTGSSSNEFHSDINIVDMNKIHLLKRASFSNPKELTRTMLDNNQIVIKKETLLLTLVFLSMGSFQAKHEFRLSFSKIVKTPNDLYKFLSLMKKYRGMGSIIHLVIKKWFITHDVHSLEKMFVGEPSRHGWNGQDIIRLIKPKPRDKKESLLFKWLSKGEIVFNDIPDYKERLPLIYAYEMFRNNNWVEPIPDLIEKFAFKPAYLPGNVKRTSDVLKKILEDKTDEEIFSYIHGRLFIEQLVYHFSDRVNSILKEDKPINSDVIEMIRLVDQMINTSIDTPIIMNLESLIKRQIKNKLNLNTDITHIIDKSSEMFNRDWQYLNAPPAVIASVLTSSSRDVYTFGGAKLNKGNIREIVEAEGGVEQVSMIKSMKLNDPKTIFVWTNRSYLGNIEKSLSNLKSNNITSKVCLINLGEGKISNKNHRYFVINGYNKNTKRLMRLIERGMM